MKLFQCQNCNQLIYFENTSCEKCGHALGYLPEKNTLLTLTPTQDDRWFAAQSPSVAYRYCANVEYHSCNWLIPADDPNTLCLACQLNRTIPDLQQPDNLERWQKLEAAKHRLVYSLLRFKLPVVNKTDDPELGLAFDFLSEQAEQVDGQPQPVTTGHADGVITINIAEADDAEREKMRESLAEPYRTLLGHFRHEIAHYYWMRFAQDEQWRTEFREVFGDDRIDYGAALNQHYAEPESDSWKEAFISAYAQAHPWEDWAETWAHYLHLIDTLETAYAFGIQIEPVVSNDESLATDMHFNAYHQSDFERIIENWLPVTFAVNSINRSMGHQDLYPFVLTPTVQTKMAFIHNTIRSEVAKR